MEPGYLMDGLLLYIPAPPPQKKKIFRKGTFACVVNTGGWGWVEQEVGPSLQHCQLGKTHPCDLRTALPLIIW